MTKYTIDGGHILHGDILINGSKNATLPILAASILNKGTTKISNCPDISDVKIMFALLEEIGCKISYKKSPDGNIAEINATEIKATQITSEKTCKCRASSLLLGALLGRCHTAELSYPGGCIIGERPLDLHKSALESMGYETYFFEDKIKSALPLHQKDNSSKHIYLNFPSVGATENALLAAAGLCCEVHIYGAATEPEIQSLGEFLTLLGATTYGLGTSHIIIRGKDSYQNSLISFNIIPDRIEAATYMIIGAGLGDRLRIHGASQIHIKSILALLRQMGCVINEYTSACCQEKETIFEINGSACIKRLTNPDIIIAKPYPGFPTDAQSLIIPLLCISKGKSIICDTVFPDRFKAALELTRAGGSISKRPYGIIVSGKRRLHRAVLKSYDLRGGAAMIIAALFAKGQSTIYDDDYIKRGYVNIAETLSSIGANIKEEPC